MVTSHLDLGWPESSIILWENPHEFDWRDRTRRRQRAPCRENALLSCLEIGDRPAGEDIQLGRPSCLLFFRIRVEMRAQQSQGMHPDAYMRAPYNAEKRQRIENLVYLFSAQSCVINVVGTMYTPIAQHKTTKTVQRLLVHSNTPWPFQDSVWFFSLRKIGKNNLLFKNLNIIL